MTADLQPNEPPAPPPRVCRVQVHPEPSGTELRFAVSADQPVVLHWGLRERARRGWRCPPPELWPAGTQDADGTAVQTPVPLDESGRGELRLRIPAELGFRVLSYVLFFPDSGQWDNNRGRDFDVALTSADAEPRSVPERTAELVAEIARVETGNGSWTLMHRFERCTELLEDARGDPELLAILFAWLRFSALRQLDWQRRYNTQPRQLTHAQSRLTQRIAALHRAWPAARSWARRLLTTVGPGGQGQRIRDDILRIMHRHHIKEHSGHFVEQWHQKLHNNATPDDVAICEAYLEFLRAHRDASVFYQALETRGITRARLESYERPLVTEPELPTCDVQELVRDFEGYLTLLKSIHFGTDLVGAAQAAGHHVGSLLRQLLDGLNQGRVTERVRHATRARELVAEQLQHTLDDTQLRDLLYLDLALENHVRTLVEQQPGSGWSLKALAQLIANVLEGLALSRPGPELGACARHWRRLRSGTGAGRRDWALHAKSVVDRLARWVSAEVTRETAELQPAADELGHAVKVEDWAISRFSEEVLRGGPLFVLSRLLRRLDPVLRERAELGAWEVVSAAQVSGRIHFAERLLEVRTESFASPAIIVTDVVQGEEEIPPGVRGIITSDSPDLMSHVAVRARNAKVLFASCLDPRVYDELKRLEGGSVAVQVTAGGELRWEANADVEAGAGQTTPAGPVVLRRPSLSSYAVPFGHFRPELVGAKSCSLAELRDDLPDWLHMPSSLALPFGAFERVMDHEANAEVRRRYAELLARLEADPEPTLAELRAIMTELRAPSELLDAVSAAAAEAGLPLLEHWEASWRSIKTVWGSKWTDRAYASRLARRIPHEALYMAVLVQEVVPADYAFVAHTANPSTGNQNEVLAEVVVGLGETLVGNHPGRALGFVCPKHTGVARLVSYPSKSVALRGSGLIFRSDSNGEDLPGYAGAGLYESVITPTVRRELIDYSNEPLVWDEDTRSRLLLSVTDLALTVERARGSAQDIEGAVADGKYFVLQTRPQVGL